MNRSLDIHQAIHTPQGGKIEPTEIVRRDHVERPNRCVRFLPSECTVYTCSDESTKTLEVDKKHLLWYQPADVRKFVSSDEELIRDYRTIVRSNQRFGRTNTIVNGTLENTAKDMESEMRGLEDHFTILSQLLHKRRLSEYCHAVLNEQLRQKRLWSQELKADNVFILDPNMIRKVSIDSSMNSKLIAHSLGQADAFFVQRLKHSSPACPVADIMHPISSGRYQHYEKSKLRQFNVAPQSLPVVAHNANTKLTITTASAMLREQQCHHIRELHSLSSTRITI